MYMENVNVKSHLRVFCQETFSHFKHLHLTPFYDGPSLKSNFDWLSLNVENNLLTEPSRTAPLLRGDMNVEFWFLTAGVRNL